MCMGKPTKFISFGSRRSATGTSADRREGVSAIPATVPSVEAKLMCQKRKEETYV